MIASFKQIEKEKSTLYITPATRKSIMETMIGTKGFMNALLRKDIKGSSTDISVPDPRCSQVLDGDTEQKTWRQEHGELW